MEVLKGVPASPGIVIGNVFLLGVNLLDVPKEYIPEEKVEKEVNSFLDALEKAKQELMAIKKRAKKDVGELQASIFDAHILLIEDPEFLKKLVPQIKQERVTAAYLVGKRASDIMKKFRQSDNFYSREKAADIRDVACRVIQNLLGSERAVLRNLKKDVIVVSRDLSPSDTVSMVKERVIGFATDIGGYTSHTAIMARALRIPAIVGVGNITKVVNAQDKVIIDGHEGVIICRPDEETIKEYEKKQKIFKDNESQRLMLRNLSAQTKDGYQLELAANIELAEEIPSVKREGVKAIGLYRTEFLFFKYDKIPDEETQFQEYKKIVEGMAPNPVTIRTIDMGGDKFVSQSEFKEVNPDLGWRGIRFCLEKRDIFLTQIRAILQASKYGNVRMMFPMISGVDEVIETKKVIETAKQQLRERNQEFSDIEIGIMIEVPSAVLTADALAEEVDFFSIGTNDLIQYTIAVDRRNEKITSMYEPLHPAVLRMIELTVKKAHQKGIWVGVCGEMAASPISAIILLGLDVDELSLTPINIPIIKHVIRSVHFKQIKEEIKYILNKKTAREITEFMKSRYGKGIIRPFGEGTDVYLP